MQTSILLNSRSQICCRVISVDIMIFRGKVTEAVKRASIKLDKSEDNIAGVLIPSMIVKENREGDESDNGMSQIGMERGGVAIQNCR